MFVFETEVKKLKLAVSISDISIRLIVSHIESTSSLATCTTICISKHFDMSQDSYLEILFLRFYNPLSVFILKGVAIFKACHID